MRAGAGTKRVPILRLADGTALTRVLILRALSRRRGPLARASDQYRKGILCNCELVPVLILAV